MKTLYITKDGKQFNDFLTAKKHEEQLNAKENPINKLRKELEESFSLYDLTKQIDHFGTDKQYLVEQAKLTDLPDEDLLKRFEKKSLYLTKKEMMRSLLSARLLYGEEIAFWYKDLKGNKSFLQSVQKECSFLRVINNNVVVRGRFYKEVFLQALTGAEITFDFSNLNKRTKTLLEIHLEKKDAEENSLDKIISVPISEALEPTGKYGIRYTDLGLDIYNGQNRVLTLNHVDGTVKAARRLSAKDIMYIIKNKFIFE